MLQRSKAVKKNIIYSILLKFFSIGISFALLPLTVHYLTEVEYGVWMTLFTVMNWVNFLDMGLGLGLRNKLAEAVSKNDFYEIRTYLSTGVFAMIGMGSILLIIFFIGVHLVNMQSIFNTQEISEQDLYISTLFTGIFVILAFVLSIINQIYYAYQKAAVTGGIQIVYNLIMLGIVYYLTLQSTHKLFYFVMSFGISTILSKGIFIIIFFCRHKNVFPSNKFVTFNKIKEISSLGIQFFIVQICCIIGFSSNNLIITQLMGPQYVQTFDIIFKVFYIIIMFYSLIMSPLWSAYTDAYVKKDFVWIKKTLKKINILGLLFIIIVICTGLFVDKIIYFWMDLKLEYPKMFITLVIIYVSLYIWNQNYMYLLNGINKLKIQMITWIFGASIIIPLSIYFIDFCGLGLNGVVLSLIASFSLSSIVLPIQVYKILKES